MSQLLPRPASNSNLINSQGISPRSMISKSTMTFRQVLLPGATFPASIPGNMFYLSASTGPLEIRPVADGPGVTNTYYAGTGLELDLVNAFQMLEIKNPHASRSVFFEIVVGFDRYIDKRLTFPNAQYSQVGKIVVDAYHPASFPAATFYSVPDLSGTVITDENGDEWYAANRQLLIVFNVDAASNDYTIVTNAAATLFLAMIQPGTSAQFPMSGDLGVRMSSGGNLGGVVTEIYNCLPVL